MTDSSYLPSYTKGPFKYRRQYRHNYDYLFDGDQWSLRPGEEIARIESFRVMLTRLCKQRGLRYRSLIHDGVLWVEIFRQTPGDLLRETDPEVANEPPTLGPWQ